MGLNKMIIGDLIRIRNTKSVPGYQKVSVFFFPRKDHYPKLLWFIPIFAAVKDLHSGVHPHWDIGFVEMSVANSLVLDTFQKGLKSRYKTSHLG